jgi:hypothetical protein
MTKKITRTSEGLRNALFDEMDNLRSGTSDTKRASMVAKLANTIVSVAKVEMEHARYEDMPKLGSDTLKLGTGGGR